jgi:hypothetical protein
VARGDTTTRDRDFADVLLLAGHHDIDAVTLSSAISATADFRQVTLRAISETLVTLGRDRQRDWERLLTRAGLGGVLPADYSEAIRRVTAFGDPLITGSLTSGHWEHRHGQWTA